MKNVKLGTNARNAPVATGQCGACDTNLYRILKKDSADGKAAMSAGKIPSSGKSKKSKKSKKSGASEHEHEEHSKDGASLDEHVGVLEVSGGRRRSISLGSISWSLWSDGTH